MPDITLYIICGLLLFILESAYFRIAERYQIIDKPNQRSSHITPTIRGGGVVFLLSVLLWFVLNGFNYPWFVLGTFLIAMVSFIDDLGEQPARIRLSVQVIAFVLLGWQAGLFGQPLLITIIMLVIGVGTINAFNFMDGINGITGVYSLVNLCSLYIIQRWMVTFADTRLIISVALGVLIFLYFNFRKKARCFAGDVGSVTIAFVQLFMVILLIRMTGNYTWSLIFLIYGIDTVVTIIYRLKNKENIFKAHRSHLFQYFSNELGMPQLWVAVIFGLLQLAVNTILILFLSKASIWYSFIFVLIAGFAYVAVREAVLRKIGIKGIFNPL